MPFTPLLLATAFVISGCTAPPDHTPAGDGRRLALGGVFWRASTRGYASQRAIEPLLTIPQRSVCDVRRFAAGWSRVKVLVGDSWHLVWVRDLAANDAGIAHHPFLTFGYVSSGTDERRDLDWRRSAVSLLAQADKEKKHMTQDELVALFGADMVHGNAQPADPAERVQPAASRPSLQVR